MKLAYVSIYVRQSDRFLKWLMIKFTVVSTKIENDGAAYQYLY